MKKLKRGFALMTKEQHLAASQKGGFANHPAGRGLSFASPAKRKKVWKAGVLARQK